MFTHRMASKPFLLLTVRQSHKDISGTCNVLHSYERNTDVSKLLPKGEKIKIYDGVWKRRSETQLPHESLHNSTEKPIGGSKAVFPLETWRYVKLPNTGKWPFLRCSLSPKRPLFRAASPSDDACGHGASPPPIQQFAPQWKTEFPARCRRASALKATAQTQPKWIRIIFLRPLS